MNKETKMWKALLLSGLISVPLSASAQSVKGQVKDATTGEPLIGVTIRSLGSKKMAVTDIDGNYTIEASGKERLRFSYVGYDDTDITVDGRKVVNIGMKTMENDLGEVVVIGYGTQRKADLTGAVGVVDMKEAKKTAATNIYEMLQGQVPSVSVSTTSQPGAMSNVMIRGVGSFNTVGPLYVLDGMIVNDVNHLNPTEIESMQVLKDASAAAIYGARGANGVILITTKKGKKGKPSLDVSATFSVADMPKKIDMMNAVDFMYYN